VSVVPVISARLNVALAKIAAIIARVLVFMGIPDLSFVLLAGCSRSESTVVSDWLFCGGPCCVPVVCQDSRVGKWMLLHFECHAG
jgi:hypothetical protein